MKDLSRQSESISPKIKLNKSIESLNSSLKKAIDTRTFTRPKKKFLKPNVDKLNEDLFNYSDENSSKENNGSVDDTGIDSVLMESYEDFSCTTIRDLINDSKESKPLQFDLNQPVSRNVFEKGNQKKNLFESVNHTRNIFENVFSSNTDLDTFQNMSPPSLVNSMCSSTFMNLMENSLIKNDPVLREIRDADYSSEILLQDHDPPVFQSLTGSCSSLNSDTAENFLRKTLGPNYNATLQRNEEADEKSSESLDYRLNETFKKESGYNLDDDESSLLGKKMYCVTINLYLQMQEIINFISYCSHIIFY